MSLSIHPSIHSSSSTTYTCIHDHHHIYHAARKDKKQAMIMTKSLTHSLTSLPPKDKKKTHKERERSPNPTLLSFSQRLNTTITHKTTHSAMKSPFLTTQNNHFFNSKPLSNTTFHHPSSIITPTPTTTTTTTTTPCYEPTSVLDLRRSPSPVPGGGGGVGGGSDSVIGFTAISGIVSDEYPPLTPSEDWDSIIWDLGGGGGGGGDHKNLPQFGTFETSNPSNHHQFDLDFNDFNPSNQNQDHPHPHHHPQNSNFNSINEFHQLQQQQQSNNNNNDGSETNNNNNIEFDCSQLEQLIRAAASIESNELHLSQVILARLNQSLQYPIGKPLQRAAFYFKEALQFFLTGSNWSIHHHHHLSPSEIVQKIRAYKSFSEISPLPLFANFTANQSLLEASDGAMFIHIIDFDIGLGGQWASYMQAIACKAKSRDVPPSSLRITAVIPEESSNEANLIKENLQQFARELGIRFQLEFVHFRSFEVLLFNAIRFVNGEMIAVNLSPSIFRLLGSSDSITGFLRFLRRLSPQITVFVDNECCKESVPSSFRRSFVNGLEFYSAMLESLEASNSGDVNLIRRIERFLLRPKIIGSVAAAARNCMLPWRELFSGAGMIPVPLSEFTESQADWLVRRAHIRGFHVAKRQGGIMLCWHERELVATSAWMC